MPALLFTAALASGQTPAEAVRTIGPAASARASVVQDLAATAVSARLVMPSLAMTRP